MSAPLASQVSRQLAKAGHVRKHYTEDRPGSGLLTGVPGFVVRQQGPGVVRVRHIEQYMPSPSSGHAVALTAYTRTLESLGYGVAAVDGRTLHVTAGVGVEGEARR